MSGGMEWVVDMGSTLIDTKAYTWKISPTKIDILTSIKHKYSWVGRAATLLRPLMTLCKQVSHTAPPLGYCGRACYPYTERILCLINMKKIERFLWGAISKSFCGIIITARSTKMFLRVSLKAVRIKYHVYAITMAT